METRTKVKQIIFAEMRLIMPRGKSKPAKAGTKDATNDVSKKVVENEKKAATSTDAKAAAPVKSEPAKTVAAVEKKTETSVTEKKAEPAVKKPAAKRGRPKGSTAKKAAEKKVVTRKKTAKTETTQEVYFEFGHEQILTERLVERIKDKWRNDGHRTSSIKSLRVYIKPEDHRAYYVINEKDNDFIEF